MQLSVDYLYERYSFWKTKIHEKGIWEADKFKDIVLVLRPPCKSYNGLFIRRFLKLNGKRVKVDRIFIYSRIDNFDPQFIDNILVHEMIHQYIHQNKIKDSSTHGKVFRHFMTLINENFQDRLKIRISDKNPYSETQHERIKIHTLLLLHRNDGQSFCCVINPGKIDFFESMLRRNSTFWNIKNFSRAYSNNPIFNRYRRCTKTLHGIKKSFAEMDEFCKAHGVLPHPPQNPS